ncbi:hydrogenase maturation nickel metallochaperone HypA [Tropicimonas marinistellae]|uniref:hydrogenase maturation nickel metallochaperone HypA n=1 Tax=Tropicimonas marinistellae TaxID=1739787 RepID=UPI00082E5989|nr:hydrogenase maturation nickel metallochaperone HypA [Tropicimonas marinistellae]
MHEMALCEGIRGIIQDQARAQNFSRVRRLRLEIGRFAGVQKEALAFAFDVVMRGSEAEGAELEMLDLPGRAVCYDCEAEVEIDDRFAPCPRCGGGKLMPTGGSEMRILDMEVT